MSGKNLFCFTNGQEICRWTHLRNHRVKRIIEKSAAPVRTPQACERMFKIADHAFGILSNPGFLAEMASMMCKEDCVCIGIPGPLRCGVLVRA